MRPECFPFHLLHFSMGANNTHKKLLRMLMHGKRNQAIADRAHETHDMNLPRRMNWKDILDELYFMILFYKYQLELLNPKNNF